MFNQRQVAYARLSEADRAVFNEIRSFSTTQVLEGGEWRDRADPTEPLCNEGIYRVRPEDLSNPNVQPWHDCTASWRHQFMETVTRTNWEGRETNNDTFHPPALPRLPLMNSGSVYRIRPSTAAALPTAVSPAQAGAAVIARALARAPVAEVPGPVSPAIADDMAVVLANEAWVMWHNWPRPTQEAFLRVANLYNIARSLGQGASWSRPTAGDRLPNIGERVGLAYRILPPMNVLQITVEFMRELRGCSEGIEALESYLEDNDADTVTISPETIAEALNDGIDITWYATTTMDYCRALSREWNALYSAQERGNVSTENLAKQLYDLFVKLQQHINTEMAKLAAAAATPVAAPVAAPAVPAAAPVAAPVTTPVAAAPVESMAAVLANDRYVRWGLWTPEQRAAFLKVATPFNYEIRYGGSWLRPQGSFRAPTTVDDNTGEMLSRVLRIVEPLNVLRITVDGMRTLQGCTSGVTALRTFLESRSVQAIEVTPELLLEGNYADIDVDWYVERVFMWDDDTRIAWSRAVRDLNTGRVNRAAYYEQIYKLLCGLQAKINATVAPAPVDFSNPDHVLLGSWSLATKFRNAAKAYRIAVWSNERGHWVTMHRACELENRFAYTVVEPLNLLRISVQRLRDFGACKEGVDRFHKVFGNVERVVTAAFIVDAVGGGLDWNWYVENAVLFDKDLAQRYYAARDSSRMNRTTQAQFAEAMFELLKTKQARIDEAVRQNP